MRPALGVRDDILTCVAPCSSPCLSDQPATYVTPHDALMSEITKQGWELKPTPQPTPRTHLVDSSISGVAHSSSDTLSVHNECASPGSADDQPVRKRKLLKPLSSVSDLLADWNPEHQVQLGFLAEAAKPAASVASNDDDDDDVVPELGGGAEATIAIGTSKPMRRKLSTELLTEFSSQGGGSGGNSGSGGGGGGGAASGGAAAGGARGARSPGGPSASTSPTGASRGGASGKDGRGSGSGVAMAGRPPAARDTNADASSVMARRPTSTTLDKARSLFIRRRTSETNVWSEARAAVRRPSPTSPPGPFRTLHSFGRQMIRVVD